MEFYHTHVLLQYTTFSPAKLGILMSMDELIGAPTYMLAGRVVDKVNVVKFNILFLLITALGGLFLIKSPTPTIFMVVFLICSVSISCTFVGIPKERIGFIRKEQKDLSLRSYLSAEAWVILLGIMCWAELQRNTPLISVCISSLHPI